MAGHLQRSRRRRKERGFWAWYERHYRLNLTISTGLFVLQLLHLLWLTLHVVSLRLFGDSYLPLEPLWETLLVMVDYTEIPALVATSFVYLHEIRRGTGSRWMHVAYLLFLNTQWLHLFWITDEFVIDTFSGAPNASILPAWLAWVAICIDYLELPVMVDTIRRVLREYVK